ncbi:hypothetical protein AVEN_241197-1 [Araneus ventricosus]|uniref:RNase H type-1 domain-containing protein n=1 Tax=Araneus ventricosus TaxID=182803 RepID=A0A4Y2D2T4_ARAVE|nr:hypothetical protein AVEN_241197-1 [Araneus ventricosus]
MTLHLKAQQEAVFINITCLRKEIEFEGISYQPRDDEEKIKSLTIHPSLFNSINQISTTEPYKEDNSLMCFTEDSRTEMGIGCSCCAFENVIKVLEWKGKLEKFHTVFQVELMGLKEAIIRASQGNEITKIWTHSLSSIMAVLDPHTSHQHVRDIQSLLTQNRNILVRWIKAHAGYRGNEEADTLFMKVIEEGVEMKALNPRCELKQRLQELFFKKWQNFWDNGNTGRSVHKLLKSVNLNPVFWTREKILFVTGHGPLPSFLNRFHLSDSDTYACGEVDDPIHYATSCPLTLSFHIRKPSTSLESLWYPRVLGNPNSSKKNYKHD